MLTQDQKDSLQTSINDLTDYLEVQMKKVASDAGEPITDEDMVKIRQSMGESGITNIDKLIPQIEYIMATQQWEFDRIVEALVAQIKVSFFDTFGN